MLYFYALNCYLTPNQSRRNREHWRRQRVLSIRRYEILMEAMTVTEFIPIVAEKLIYCFLLQIQQQLLKHEDGSCFPLVLYIFHISCRHKLCHVGPCWCVHCNRNCWIKCKIWIIFCPLSLFYSLLSYCNFPKSKLRKYKSTIILETRWL